MNSIRKHIDLLENFRPETYKSYSWLPGLLNEYCALIDNRGNAFSGDVSLAVHNFKKKNMIYKWNPPAEFMELQLTTVLEDLDKDLGSDVAQLEYLKRKISEKADEFTERHKIQNDQITSKLIKYRYGLDLD